MKSANDASDVRGVIAQISCDWTIASEMIIKRNALDYKEERGKGEKKAARRFSKKKDKSIPRASRETALEKLNLSRS